MTSVRDLLPASSGVLLRPDRYSRYAAALGPLPLAEPAIGEQGPTPTVNLDLPFQRGGFASLCAALDYAARGETGLNFFDARGRLLHVLPYRRLQREAHAFARRLIGAGFARGERIVVIAETYPDFCVAFFGAQYAGVVPVPVAMPIGMGAKDGYIEQLRRQIDTAGATAVMAPPELVGFARTAAENTTAFFVGSMADFDELVAPSVPLRPFESAEACYVQFSSGSTRAPQGVDIRQDRLMANIDGSLAAQELCETDAGVSWLPLYHDMGLIGFVLAPMCAQRSVDLMAPHEFARRPMQWLSLISRRRATITYSPSFGYDLAVRRASTQGALGIDLSSLRLAGIGADMIQPAVLGRFAEFFAAQGFDQRAFMPSYGMAELCVGLSFAPLQGGVKIDSFACPETGRPRDFVVCGKVMDGHQVEIRDGAGATVGKRQVGRLFVRGPSVMPGYFRRPMHSVDPIRDGWLDTGDLGYWCEGELVITGRAKELIIVNGRNVWPQDIEWAIEALPSVRRGDCCAFSVDAGEREKVVVLVEVSPAPSEQRLALERDIRQAVKEAVGLDGEIVFIGRRPGLPRTSSGKLARMKARAQFLGDALNRGAA